MEAVIGRTGMEGGG
jgi:hypothetical protein